MANASLYRPSGRYDLITCFYIQMFPPERANMLAKMSNALAPGGTLLFVSHDKSNPPSGWPVEDLPSLTTPEEVVAELPKLKIEQALVLNHDPGGSHMRDGAEQDPHQSSSTLVRAIRPAD